MNASSGESGRSLELVPSPARFGARRGKANEENREKERQQIHHALQIVLSLRNFQLSLALIIDIVEAARQICLKAWLTRLTRPLTASGFDALGEGPKSEPEFCDQEAGSSRG